MGPYFDYDTGETGYEISDSMLMNSDGDLMMKMSDSMAMDMDSGELHIISSFSSSTNNDDFND